MVSSVFYMSLENLVYDFLNLYYIINSSLKQVTFVSILHDQNNISKLYLDFI